MGSKSIRELLIKAGALAAADRTHDANTAAPTTAGAAIVAAAAVFFAFDFSRFALFFSALVRVGDWLEFRSGLSAEDAGAAFLTSPSWRLKHSVSYTHLTLPTKRIV